MSIVDYLFAPRLDRFGSKTPSEASRIFFLIVILSVSYWAWQVSNGIISIWFMIVIFISTPILSIGWWLLSLISKNLPEIIFQMTTVFPTKFHLLDYLT